MSTESLIFSEILSCLFLYLVFGLATLDKLTGAIVVAKTLRTH